MRSELMELMGEEKLRWWPMVDQLVFLEDLDSRDAQYAAQYEADSPMGIF